MRPWFIRNLIIPVHERLLRRKTLRYLRELERSQWLAPDDFRRLQQAKLRALFAHAWAHTEFYRERLYAVGVDRHALTACDPFEVLNRLPLLTKDEVRGSSDEMLWRDAPGGLHAHNTGGSTGEPLTFYFDRRRQGYDQAARLRSQRWYGVKLGEPQLYLWGSPVELRRTDRLKTLRDFLFNHRLLDAFNMSSERLDGYLNAWNRFRPVSLYGYPSSIRWFVGHAQAHRRKLDTARLRAVFTTGEVCYPHDRETIASYFDVPVADGYGSRDAGFIAHECPEGSLHLTAENVIVEIVDKGKPCPIGTTGEIVVTHLDAYAMPFIRYRTGDMGRLKTGRCACGRGLPLMDVVHGRSTDFLYLPDGTVKHALSIIYPLREIAGVRQFRVTQGEDYALTVDVVCDDRGARLSHEAVARRIRRMFGDAIPVRVRLQNALSVGPSGKFRYVVSHARAGVQERRKEAELAPA